MTSKSTYTEPEILSDESEIPEIAKPSSNSSTQPGHNAFIGFAAGICSGWTKLIVGHPFDTIKTRLHV